ncbi:uncharacterized protein LOC129738749 [Uranotaenia lowii]|uniref:uncharacterized protein LOC129738749 n=1 Tax=Uranotaenia lowii TaxID=190385 RepID=UPI00247AF374|nr:uncharacterized protein LOC129738749 [Uranotaenia lowii]
MDILHPHLMSKKQLLELFQQRQFSIPRLEELSRDELINLYCKHLLPMPQRAGGSKSSTSAEAASRYPNDVEMVDATATPRANLKNVRQRIVYSESNPVENVSHGFKRIRLINSGDCARKEAERSPAPETKNVSSSISSISKRTIEISPSKTGVAVNAAPSKRQKITWP